MIPSTHRFRSRVVCKSKTQLLIDFTELHPRKRKIVCLGDEHRICKYVIVPAKDPDEMMLRPECNQDIFDAVIQIQLVDDFIIRTDDFGGPRPCEFHVDPIATNRSERHARFVSTSAAPMAP
jgi:hypothetical protein